MSDRDVSELGRVLVDTLVMMKSSFKRLEILGQFKKLSDENFFFRFIKEGAFNIEELIIDSILKKQQLVEICKALKLIIDGP